VPVDSFAANSAYRDIIILLKKRGADVNTRDNKGETALMNSMEGPGDNLKTLQQLLNLGAAPNVRSKAGKTALSIALKEHYTESIRLLKQAGARQ
jgi:ankyrin repeat protein